MLPFAGATCCLRAEMGSAGFETKLLWFCLAQACLLLAAAVGISILAEFIRPGIWLSRRHILLLYAPAVLSGALILTNPAHGLIWKRQWLDEFVHVARSPLAWGILIYLVTIYLVMCIGLVRFVVRWPVFRWPAGILLAGTLSTLFVDVLVAGSLLPRTPLDPTILAVNLNLTLYVLGIIGFRQLLALLCIYT